MELTVDRRFWIRGKGQSNSRMWCDMDNTMCCLGFLAIACGYERSSLKCSGTPSHVVASTKSDLFPTGLINAHSNILLATNTQECEQIMDVNDYELCSDEQREERLQMLFKAIGVNVTFAH